MNLTVDIGNTRTKIGVFEGDQLQEKWIWEKWEIKDLFQLVTNQRIENVILSTVAGSVNNKLKRFFRSGFCYIELDSHTPLPIRNLYKTPETLGKDRLAAVVGAYQLYTEEACLIIDAGTCITYDFLRADGAYLGGNIAPGLHMRLEAMHKFTAQLPKVEIKENDQMIGQSTQSAMQNGGIWGAILEIEGYIRYAQSKFGQINVILTGGDADFFAKKMKSRIFVNHNLVLIGLNKILNYNVECL